MSSSPDQSKPNGQAVLMQQRIIASAGFGVLRGPRRLPQVTDDSATGLQITPQTYEQMACDSEVAAALLLLVYFALADGVQLAPAASEKDDRFELATEITEHLNRTISGLERTLKETLEMMLRDALTHGNKIAEKVYDIPTEGPDAFKIVLKQIKVKPRGSASFVVDEYMNLLGLVPANQATGMGTLSADANVIPVEKFVIATFRMRDEDPRGQSLLRPAVKAWNVKQLAWPEFLTFLMRCAIPALVAILSDQAQDEFLKDADGNVQNDPSTGQPITLSAVKVMLNALLEFKNSTALVAEHGTEIKPLEVRSNGEVFERAFMLLNKEIRKGILLQELATADAAHQTKASTSEQMGIVELLVWSIKHWIGESIIRKQICRPQVAWNYGEAVANELTPVVALGDYDRKDWSLDATAIAALLNTGKLSDSQEQAILLQVGIPPREDGEGPKASDDEQAGEETTDDEMMDDEQMDDEEAA